MLFAMIGRLTQESLAAFVENPIDRFGPASRSVEAAGGRLQQMYQTAEGMTFLIVDVPDVQTLTAVSVSVQAINRLEAIRIHRLQTTAEFAEGCRRAQSVRGVQQFPTQ
ncbi:MAG TPA: GYD domain-containing protein [Rhodopila sp.]|nr:GYD domain-containing protein [Rhodopila sp.]